MANEAALRVLVVDDSRIARLTLMRILQSLSIDMEMLQANSADEAEAVLEQESQPADVALIDFNMPGRDGLELAEALKAKYPDTRMALVTANIQDALAARARSIGLAFLPKPINVDQLGLFIRGEA
ncbi:MAG: response regulator [Oceanospirillaceae bacterium]|nr:response regulator [Oceanospirillaceae bacterium]